MGQECVENTVGGDGMGIKLLSHGTHDIVHVSGHRHNFAIFILKVLTIFDVDFWEACTNIVRVVFSLVLRIQHEHG